MHAPREGGGHTHPEQRLRTGVQGKHFVSPFLQRQTLQEGREGNLVNCSLVEPSRRPLPSVHAGPLNTTLLLQATGAGEGQVGRPAA